MSNDLRQKLMVDPSFVDTINRVVTNPDNSLVSSFMDVVKKYGTPEEIQEKARAARQLPNILRRLGAENSPYLADLEWLIKARDDRAFASIDEFRASALTGQKKPAQFGGNGVVMEISACQYFPWLIDQAKHAINHREIMPGRFIRVRDMAESAADQGDLLAMMAAMEIMGTSYVETLNTRGTDGSNIHLNGPDTLLGYFTCAGEPNDYPLKWIDEFLHYHTEYGVREVLTFNPGTMLLGYWLGRLGIDIKLKVSVFAGTDNPWSFLYMLMIAKMFAGQNGETPLSGVNPTNATDTEALLGFSEARQLIDMTDQVRIEHHLTNFYKGMVKQPYLRRDQFIEIADKIENMAAKHEGGDPEIDALRTSPSAPFNYFRSKQDLLDTGDICTDQLSYMDKHDSVNKTARELTRHGLTFGAAPTLHQAG
ncbi:hypothetical protein [Castellaniella sp.]|uniref:hypothetical protein n=1 Tax=Castellaniella sp. TaxID=1955812 RepID=UPI003A8F2B88